MSYLYFSCCHCCRWIARLWFLQIKFARYLRGPRCKSFHVSVIRSSMAWMNCRDVCSATSFLEISRDCRMIFREFFIHSFWISLSMTFFKMFSPFLSVCRSSFIASLGSAVASTPIDVIRVIIKLFLCRLMSHLNLVWFIFIHQQTRLMNQKHLRTPNSSAPNKIDSRALYKGSIDCFIQTVRNEGFRALYKGFIPTWVRMGPWNIIFFISYEQLKKCHWDNNSIHR